MDLNFAIMLAQRLLFLRTQILVSEKNNAAFSNQKGQLIPLLGSKIFQLQTDDNGNLEKGQYWPFPDEPVSPG